MIGRKSYGSRRNYIATSWYRRTLSNYETATAHRVVCAPARLGRRHNSSYICTTRRRRRPRRWRRLFRWRSHGWRRIRRWRSHGRRRIRRRRPHGRYARRWAHGRHAWRSTLRRWALNGRFFRCRPWRLIRRERPGFRVQTRFDLRSPTGFCAGSRRFWKWRPRISRQRISWRARVW